ncbi:cytoskeletal protein binding protein [Aspergillus nanangensis]|uniref:Actin cytoskeleton-regulatory complex protein SLA1 n=1 Tax=Aspergillus nanangensis TaxID=2582783 RepID=A0AAD4CXE3_ASPNN|nr:cytoskeletal protein binding protein [Aspergillus nanangensis]
MGFLGIYTALYDYQPQAQGELELREGDLLYLLHKSDEDDWWRAKKKADREDEDEPEGLVANNYVEEAQPIYRAKALYDYTRQTDEEVSFSEDAELMVYDTSDPDWTLVGINSDCGFAPSNYIDIHEETAQDHTRSVPTPPTEPAPPSPPQRPVAAPVEETNGSPASSPNDAAHNHAAAAIAKIIHKQHTVAPEPETSRAIPSPPQPHYEEEDRYDREPSPPPPALPLRPPSEQVSSPVRIDSPAEPYQRPRPQFSAAQERELKSHVKESPPHNRVGGQPAPRSPSGYHIYNINEMVEVMGKQKKMPTTLGINIATGTIFISPEGDDEVQEWTAEKLSNYSIEGKHVFVELVRPSKSIDFHAGAKDTAREIVGALGEICGAYRAEGLKEVIAAGAGGGGLKKGQVLYDFMAQGDDEVTVAVGDEVVVLDDTKSEEWWMVRRLKNDREGVVPSSYVEITGIASPPPSAGLSPAVGVEPGLSAVERNRREEARLTKEASHKSRTDSMDSKNPERQKRESRHKSKPEPSKTRSWTDRTKTFTVDAQFIGLQDGKIHLHKTNGVKIAVPIAKMSVEDLEYVEKATGVSLDEDKPLSDIRRRSQSLRDAEKDKAKQAGASFQQSDYDWFDFFLKAGVGPHQCERYAQNFVKDSMDEGILPDITPEVLRTLGLKEGDVLRVMRYLDSQYNRSGGKSKLRNVSFGGEEVISNGEDGGLFAGPGGMLRNNTRKGRPAPAVQAGDVVDPKAFSQKDDSKPDERQDTPPPATAQRPVKQGFDDDAWEVKQPRQSAPVSSAPAPTASPPATASPVTSAPAQKPLVGAMADLSLLHPALQPTPAQPAPPAPAAAPAIQPQVTAVPVPQPQPQPQPQQQPGATPNFFAQLGQQQQQQPLQNNAQGFSPQATGFQSVPRQRPQAPQAALGSNTLLPPPPQRPLSAPQNFPQQQNTFGAPPLQPQLTGLPQNGPPIAPPGQSLAELNQQRFQPSFQQQQQPTGFMPQNQFPNGIMPQPTGFQPQSQFGMQQQQTGFQGMPPQPTGYGGFQPQLQQPMQTGINASLPPAMQPQPTGMNGAGHMPYTASSPPPVPPIPQQPTAAPLQPQKTGPAPPVRFGVKPGAPNKLTPQPTGRANLSQATPANPFGF